MKSLNFACRDINELNPIAQKACRLFLQACEKNGIKIFITETYRSQERQNYLYEQGRSREGNIVTWTKKSNHTGRMAWDIACYPPNNLYDSKTLRKAGEIATSMGITWGGTWNTPDKPHFEVTADFEYKEEENLEKRYNTLSELPSWAVPIIKKLVDEKKIADENNLDLSTDMLRILVIMNR